MIRTADSMGKKLMVAETIKFSPSHQRAERLIKDGRIGDPFMFTTRAQFYVPPGRFQGANTGWRSDSEKICGGVLLESGIHNIATATYLMGPVESVSAFKGRQIRKEITVEDTLVLLLRFKSGAIGQGNFSWGTRLSEYTDDFTVFGTEGTTGNSAHTGRIFLDNGRGEYKQWTETDVPPGKSREIAHFLRCIDDDAIPITDGPSETENLRVVMAAYRSAEEGQIVRVEDVRS
jgi:predicted dehydrogenase